ncbi:MAG TPA: DUF4136 domain-containing protein [Xanthomonadales bacterium]|nr:DUF4136 domain-containing protein [Xanthomonadales bacterium]
MLSTLTLRNLLFRLLPLAVFGFSVSACATQVHVRSDISTTADFSSFRTYGYFQPMGIEAGYNSPVFGELFRTAISREMESRGYQLSSQPDLIINVTARFDEKIKMTSYTEPYMSGMYYGSLMGPSYGSAVGVGVAMGSRPTETEEISVFIDLVDNKAERIAWQGVAVFDGNDKMAQELEKSINDTVGKIFAQYTKSAGN